MLREARDDGRTASPWESHPTRAEHGAHRTACIVADAPGRAAALAVAARRRGGRRARCAARRRSPDVRRASCCGAGLPPARLRRSRWRERRLRGAERRKRRRSAAAPPKRRAYETVRRRLTASPRRRPPAAHAPPHRRAAVAFTADLASRSRPSIKGGRPAGAVAPRPPRRVWQRRAQRRRSSPTLETLGEPIAPRCARLGSEVAARRCDAHCAPTPTRSRRFALTADAMVAPAAAEEGAPARRRGGGAHRRRARRDAWHAARRLGASSAMRSAANAPGVAASS